MLQKKIPGHCWTYGLTRKQISAIEDSMGREYLFEHYSLDDPPALEDAESSPPFILWLSMKGMERILALPKDTLACLEAIPKAIMLSERYTKKDLENAMQNGLAEVVIPPLNRPKARNVLKKAMEIHAMHSDMHCMTREILLERELLRRKNELLSFLVNFLSSTSEELDISHILQKAFCSLNMLFPLHSLNAAVWSEDEEGKFRVDLHIAAADDSASGEKWRAILLEHVESQIGSGFKLHDPFILELPEHDPWSEPGPGDGHLLCLPISAGNEKFGVLMLLTDLDRNLGRDQARSLDSAIRHLGLTLHNTRRFSKIQRCNDYDVLTRVHSRRHFEERLKLEMESFARYGQPFSLLMLDIDFFKKINDTFGHHAGDMALRGVADIMAKTIRGTDYCARYGGEEFVVILPHTDKDQALALAERLRLRIERHPFKVEGRQLRLTASIGLAEMPPSARKDSHTLMREADTALYLAKSAGRNCTKMDTCNLSLAAS